MTRRLSPDEQRARHVAMLERNTALEPWTGCIIWLGSKTQGGHGKTGRWYAHRLAWELAHGPIPAGLFVCHDCPAGDNPSCVNVEHLFLGTALQNTLDMIAKGRKRTPRGADHYRAKLSWEDVCTIRSLCAGGEKQVRLAERYGVTQSTISYIVSNRRWQNAAMAPARKAA